ncbi:MAG TPA: cell division protein FtsL [Desulfobacteria bacterium]|nr:cell division protein FtsL [Desulfobacteria bacterium]
MVVARETVSLEQLPVFEPEPGKKAGRQIHKSDTSKQAKAIAMVLVAIIFLMGIGIAWEYSRLAIKNFQISKLKKDIAAAQMTNDSLQLGVDKLRSVSRIESMAINQLGMVKPAQYAFLNYNDKVNENAQSPTAGAVSANKPAAVSQQPHENPIIRQVAQFFSGLISPAQ